MIQSSNIKTKNRITEKCKRCKIEYIINPESRDYHKFCKIVGE